MNGRELPNVPDVQIFVQGQYTFELPWDASVIPRALGFTVGASF